jgi:hypothetical protein
MCEGELRHCHHGHADAATRAIREKERANGSHTLIVAMTAHAFPEDEKRCLSAGLDAYIPKPTEMKNGIAMTADLTARATWKPDPFARLSSAVVKFLFKFYSIIPIKDAWLKVFISEVALGENTDRKSNPRNGPGCRCARP